ncbi:DUF2716 domain-containing protein [Streptomyces erythrochromogenes]|uniref:DUF2716 domain-containing protein n=1 Tax=Streptomyces erythrochromogenes TaxID=285574 RepID=UPI00131E724A|nr:DUF2716 domain-containing protein [Streptomyces erythrochromogenes]MCX5581802.1 DUF2716 domain-containing protein [Streptomyces erythrochromogenes]
MDTGGVLARYDEQVRGRVPAYPPPGAVIERDGPFVRTHYGTHGTVEHGPLPQPPGGGTVRRQLEAFAARGEPVHWKAYGHDPDGQGEALAAAGFTAGPERSLLAAAFDRLEPPGRAGPRTGVHSLNSGGRENPWWEAARTLAAASGPHASTLADFEADGGCRYGQRDAAVLLERGEVVAAGWAEVAAGTDFLLIGGLTGPHAEFPGAWRAMVEPPEHYHRHLHRPVPYCVAEAAGELRTGLIAAGFAELSTVRTYAWDPPGTPPADRPVGLIDPGAEDRLWDRLEREFAFDPHIAKLPGFAASTPCATWRLRSTLTDEPDLIVRPALVANTRPGGRLVWLDWQHTGYTFDPHRVGFPGAPDWPGEVCPNGDYYLYLHPDLTFGTFGHPWEETLTVFGAPLLAAVEGQLTALLGDPVRRRD